MNGVWSHNSALYAGLGISLANGIILVWDMPQMQDNSLNRLTCSPVCWYFNIPTNYQIAKKHVGKTDSLEIRNPFAMIIIKTILIGVWTIAWSKPLNLNKTESWEVCVAVHIWSLHDSIQSLKPSIPSLGISSIGAVAKVDKMENDEPPWNASLRLGSTCNQEREHICTGTSIMNHVIIYTFFFFSNHLFDVIWREELSLC